MLNTSLTIFWIIAVIAAGVLGLAIGARLVRDRQRRIGEESLSLVTTGRIAAGLMHDLNNLLMSIGSNVEQLLETDSSGLHDDVRRRIAALTGCARRLTGQVTSLAAGQQSSTATLELRQRLRAIEPVLVCLAGRQAHIRIDLRCDPVSINMRRSDLDQVLLNLVLNAREAGATMIDVELDIVQQTAGPRASRRPMAVIKVLDNGPGIPKVALASATLAFFTYGKPAGTGIGLSTVQRIAEEVGGDFQLGNRKTGGVEARFAVPIVDAPLAEAPEVTFTPADPAPARAEPPLLDPRRKA